MARLALLLPSLAAAAVTPLHGRNFQERILAQHEQMSFVYFFAPWCGHCKRLAPIFEEVAAMPAYSEAVTFGKVDCTEEKPLCSKYNVSGFPSIHWMQHGRTWEHRGPRTKDGLQAMIDRMRRPAVKQLQAASDLKALRDAGPGGVAFVLGRGSLDHAAHAVFDDMARTRQNMELFGAMNSPADLDSGLPTAVPFVAKLEPNEPPTVLEPAELGAMDAEALGAWVKAHRFPLCSMLSRSNFFDLLGDGKKLVVLLLNPSEYCSESETGEACDTHELTVADTLSGSGGALRSLSRDASLQDLYHFGILDGKKWAEFAEEHLIDPASLPRVLVLDHKKKAYYNDAPGDAKGADGMRDFLVRLGAGSVRAEYEDWKGLPDRWWQTVLSYMPFLNVLNVLPRYTFVSITAMVVLFLLYKLMMLEAEEGDYAPMKRD